MTRIFSKKDVSPLKKNESNRSKAMFCGITALLILIILLFFKGEIANLLISLSATDAITGLDISEPDAYIRYQNAIVYGSIGLIIFYLLSSIGYFLESLESNTSPLIGYSHLIAQLFRWIAILLFFDMVLQNLIGQRTSLSNYSAQYRTIGAIIGVSAYILVNYWHTKGTNDNHDTKNQL